MAQPNHVPVGTEDRVRGAETLPAPDVWRPDRPAEIPHLTPPRGPRFGSPGPDLGYGLKLAKRFGDRLKLQPGEHLADAVAGCFGVGAKRAAVFGRGPVPMDFELAYTVWGFLDMVPGDLLRFRKELFAGAAEHYWDQRTIVDVVRETTLRMTPDMVRERLQGWRDLFHVE
ncbi:MAG: hypothetical protein ACLGHT_06995 [Acidimicrobiia bacterium]